MDFNVIIQALIDNIVLIIPGIAALILCRKQRKAAWWTFAAGVVANALDMLRIRNEALTNAGIAASNPFLGSAEAIKAAGEARMKYAIIAFIVLTVIFLGLMLLISKKTDSKNQSELDKLRESIRKSDEKTGSLTESAQKAEAEAEKAAEETMDDVLAKLLSSGKSAKEAAKQASMLFDVEYEEAFKKADELAKQLKNA